MANAETVAYLRPYRQYKDTQIPLMETPVALVELVGCLAKQEVFDQALHEAKQTTEEYYGFNGIEPKFAQKTITRMDQAAQADRDAILRQSNAQQAETDGVLARDHLTIIFLRASEARQTMQTKPASLPQEGVVVQAEQLLEKTS